MSDYTRKSWEKGDVISAEALNNMEQGIYNANETAKKAKEAIPAPSADQAGNALIVNESGTGYKFGKAGEAPNWNAKEGEPGHVKNRTHWVEGGMVDILVSGEWIGPSNYKFAHTLGLEIGKKYIVSWHDGVDYEDIAHEVDDEYGYRISVGDEGNGYPFEIIQERSGATFVSGAAGDFSIKGEKTIIHKLGNKFLDWEWMPTAKGDQLLAEQTLNADEATPDGSDITAGTYRAFFSGTIDLNETSKIVVEVDGVKYDAYYVIGDGINFICSYPDTPALIDGKFWAYFAEGAGVFFHIMAGEHTFAVYKKVINKMPAEFLPDGIPYMEENVLLQETDASSFTHPSFGTMWAIYGGTPKLTVGETYTVTYNGTAYKCVCQAAPAGLIEDPNAVAMGNFSPVGGANTGEPFSMLVSYAYQEIDIIDLVGSSSVKVKIHRTTAASEMYLSSPNGTVFKITVSDDGALSAAAVTQ